jgi:hypothetical protein
MANLGMLDPDEVQPVMFAALKTLCPEIKFVTYGERPTRFREWATALLKDGQKYSYEFMASLEVSPHPADTAISRLGGRVEISGLTPDDPCDLSLRSTGYAQGSPPELSAVAHACGEQGATAFCHVFASTEGTEARVFCFALDSADHQAAIPIGVTVRLDDLIKLLTGIAPRHLVVKIDERWGADAAGLLVSTGHAVFRLLHDTSPASAAEFRRFRLAQQGEPAGGEHRRGHSSAGATHDPIVPGAIGRLVGLGAERVSESSFCHRGAPPARRLACGHRSDRARARGSNTLRDAGSMGCLDSEPD